MQFGTMDLLSWIHDPVARAVIRAVLSLLIMFVMWRVSRRMHW